MESHITATQDSSNPTPAIQQKQPKRRFSKLKADEIGNLPGVDPIVVKKVEPGLNYYLAFIFPVTDVVGTPDEAGRVHGFVAGLDSQAKSKNVGRVASVNAANGLVEVVLKLEPVGEVPNHGVPANNAFSQLKDFISTQYSLRDGPYGKSAKWKAKVNGTTIIEGRF